MARTPEEKKAADKITYKKWRLLHKKLHNKRVQELQDTYRKRGKCIQCGKPRNKSKVYCDYHLKQKNGQQRLRRYLKKNGLWSN